MGGADWPQTQNNHYRLDLQMYCMTVNVLSDWLTDDQLLPIKGSQPSLFQTLAVQLCLMSNHVSRPAVSDFDLCPSQEVVKEHALTIKKLQPMTKQQTNSTFP